MPSSSSTDSATNTTPLGSSSTLLTSPLFFTKKVSLQLNEDNYLLWKQQISLTIRSHNLHYLLNDSVIVPPTTIVENGKEFPNPEFLTYEQQDSALASWLLASISPSLIHSLVGLTTSATIWKTLIRIFDTQTTTRIMHIHSMLKGQRKGNKSMRKYLSGIKSLCDSLASCGERVSNSIHLSTILTGLTPEYEPVIVVITASQHFFTVQQVTSVLLDAEAGQQDSVIHLTASANLSPSYQSSPQPTIRFPFQGRGRGRGNRHQCQLCGRLGHLVNRCFYRFDLGFTGPIPGQPLPTPPVQQPSNAYPSHHYQPSPSPFNPPSSTPTQTYSPSRFAYSPISTPPPFTLNNLASSHNYGNGTCFSSSQLTPQAHIATPKIVNGSAWYPESGATHHITNDPANVNNASHYTGSGTITVGNENSLPFTHIGQSSLLTSSKPLLLSNILFAPQVTKNLLSVSKFTKDNNVMFKSFPSHCSVKDLVTKEMLLQAHEYAGLYHLNFSSLQKSSSNSAAQVKPTSSFASHSASACNSFFPSCHLVSSKYSYDVWHRRLGHPSPKVVHYYLKDCNASFLKASLFESCIACHMGKMHKLPFKNSHIVYTEPLELIEGPQNGLPASAKPLSRIIPLVVNLNNNSILPPHEPTSTASERVVSSLPADSRPAIETPVNTHPILTKSKVGIYKPKAYNIDLTSVEHVSIHEAMLNDKWTETIYVELQALINNGTWSLVPFPSSQKVIRQVDINNVFLNGDLKEEVFMKQPPGFEQTDSDGRPLVCKLHKALYGLKQAPRAWFEKLRDFLIDKLGFKESVADPALFYLNSSSYVTYLVVYVDDIIITGNNDCFIEELIDHLHLKFSLKDLGLLSFFLGIEIHRIGNQLLLNQKKYITEILLKANMFGSHSTSTPMVRHPPLSLTDGVAHEHTKEYRSIVGALQYVGFTLPDIAFSFNKFKPVIWCDNTSTIALASNPILRSKTKHLELDLHFTKEKVVAGQVNVNFVPASQQIADGFTRPITRDKFILFRNQLGVLPQKLSPRIHNIEDETEHKSSTLDEQGEY
ncbi:hypothetical protein MTR67_032401 [Solanum verrucosum]|uniref:Uncharacterized protein n=1 Tax=Solanum verrucosum TaxID=315347 RepID=A0AAF0ZFJ8_SOLVR|nr:hypothetical protein MTR67_032401 [Solanum verrucosum]